MTAGGGKTVAFGSGVPGVPIGGGVGGGVATAATDRADGAAKKKTAVAATLAAIPAIKEDVLTALRLLGDPERLLLTPLV